MYCTHCGTQVADTDKFCPECGAPIERPAEAILSSSPDGEAASPVMGVDPDAPHDVPGIPDATAPQSPGGDSSPDKGSSTLESKKSHKALWITLTCAALAAVIAVALIVWHPWSRNGAKENPLPDVTGAPIATEESAAELSPEEAVLAAFNKLSDVDSLHVDLVEDASLTIGIPAVGYTQDMDLLMVLGCNLDKRNGTSRIEGSVSLMGYEQNVLAYAETVDGSVRTYISTDSGKTWTLQDQENASENAVISDPTASVDLWMKHAKAFEKTGTEQVNGFDTTVYTGSLSGEYVKDSTGMVGEMFGGLDEAMLNDLDDLPITVWIDNESGCVVRMVLDMKSMMATIMVKTLMESMGELPEGIDLSIDVHKAEIVCDMSMFNAIPPIVIPDEVR